VLVLASSCIPRGALSFNPKLIEGNNSLESDGEDSQEGDGLGVKEGKEGQRDLNTKDAYVNGAQVPSVEKI
jgi:hypothetical protein